LHQLGVAGVGTLMLHRRRSGFGLPPVLVVSAAAVRGLWAQAAPVPVIAHVFSFGFSPRVIWLSSGSG